MINRAEKFRTSVLVVACVILEGLKEPMVPGGESWTGGR